MSSAPRREFAELLLPTLRRAARLARDLEGHVGNVPKLSEATAVKQALTGADTGVQELLLAGLREHFPDVCLEAEEDTESVSLFPAESDGVVVIDPIDGTLRSYLEARGPYAVLLGLAEERQGRRRYLSSLVALPREGLTFGATRGEGAFSLRVDGPARPVRARADGNRVLVSHDLPDVARAVLREAGLEVVPACGGAIAVAPLVRGVCAGLRHQRGPAGISVRGRIGLLIAREAGALLRCGNGDEFPDDLDGVAPTLSIATSEVDLAVLQNALEAAELV